MLLCVKQWCGCHQLGFLPWALTQTHVTAHGGCANAVRESVLKVESEREKNLSHWGTEPRSILHLTFWSDTLPTELSRPSVQWALPLLFFFYPSDLSKKKPDLSWINLSSANHSIGNQPLSPTTRQNYPNNSWLQKTTRNNHAFGDSIQSVNVCVNVGETGLTGRSSQRGTSGWRWKPGTPGCSQDLLTGLPWEPWEQTQSHHQQQWHKFTSKMLKPESTRKGVK